MPGSEGTYREAPGRPAPPRPPVGLATAAAFGCIALAIFTSTKLFRMAQLRGDIGGIDAQEMTIGRELRRFNPGSAVYELRKPDSDAVHEIQINERGAHRNRTGERISVRCIGRDCYSRADSVYIDDGNRQFDIMLLALELSGLVTSVVIVRRRLRAWREAQRLVAPPRA
ncbi:MAG: hypothetical protein JNK04_26310 [Myxococcales bacterium]|nr:hypothetical protein [Myxococcales bacterium]